ncbi:MAG: methylmalonyl Co-A mutase-associated GTPase MeaB [Candidatus Thermoplasmatota archaeon]|nr:methylmalonyl Co-A mutase-associated GTPase MeaB [Candidatus Sysuiplasma jiujiangense]MBX8638737.1 methylmalonyl Co-A mutase-associated GTPase MeaB [Candidatus Sysuiplasma jiujiangense]MBX8642110.1 methylmalonyl Co-A mutase-associated GTPase MeaB [Candidatus Sysuiplasma jiujiangense]MCL4316909.1 methylmalonyl Co-A mutase-associated GTPase MeaB [Candidatus Thermoplasmatota archaeon]MCL5252809.1 methylmalonyl Co-A mutase-associated GTPase MeaB [Candidatus Thermoplasmatota archaeon]
MDYSTLITGVINGDRKAAARLISLVEDEENGYREALERLYGNTRGVPVLGITGAPGVGKSTIALEITKMLRAQGRKIGIVAVDPTSPVTGGAILGDRIRMTELFADPGVFIRSMGSRGGSGGLSSQTGSVVRILDAMGCDEIIVETVGAGQTQVDIMGMADTIVVVTMPGSGDEVQSIKAGLLEIADIYVVNKIDLAGGMRTVSDIQSMLDLVDEWHGWKPPVIQANAREGRGMDELVRKIEEHNRFALESEHLSRRKKEQYLREIQELVTRELSRRIFESMDGREIEDMLKMISERKENLYSEADSIIKAFTAGKLAKKHHDRKQRQSG